MRLSIKELIESTGAEVLVSKGDTDVETFVSTDTRTLQSGDFYLPLKGESFDGEKFVSTALKQGAIGCFVTQSGDFASADYVLKVADTKIAYLNIANYVRKKYNPKTIAITGSSGKTTTKEMVYAVCNYKFKTQKTFSNHNNEIGCSQTILGMSEGCEVLIVEMGMRALGEIELLSKTVEPDVAIITNAGSAHVGRLGSLDNIAIAKSEIILGLKSDGLLIANSSERLKKFAKFDGATVFFSLSNVEILDMKAGYSKFIYKDEVYEINVEGEYNIENSLTAIEVGKYLGMTSDEIRQGLLEYKTIEKRWEVENVGGYKIINDSYNANPESMKASVLAFAQLYENPLVILGNMGELGEDEFYFHRQVGEYLSGKINKNVMFLTVGNLAQEIGKVLEKTGFSVKSFVSCRDVSRYIVENVNINTTIFLKASRSMKFEEIISELKGEIKL